MLENSSHKVLLRLRPAIFVVAAIVWVIAAYIVAIFVTKIVLTLAALVGLNINLLSQNTAAFVANALVWIIMLPVLVLPLVKSGIVKRVRQEFGLERLPSWLDIALVPLAFILYFVLSMVLNVFATSLLTGHGYDPAQAQDIGFSAISQRYELILAFLALVVCAPLVEEIIFRGFLYARLKKHIGLIGGILVTSLVFAVLHMQLNVGIDVFALSIILCTLREVTGSIWAGVLLHMTKNGLAYYILFAMPML